MAIRVNCAGCGKAFRVKDELAGKQGKCPACGHMLVVPAPDQAAEQEQLRTPVIPPARAGQGVPVRRIALVAVGVLVIAAVLVVALMVSGGPPKAATPEEALRGFVSAVEQGNISRAVSYCTDKEVAEAAIRVAVRSKELEKALDEHYGAEDGGLRSRGFTDLTPGDLESEDLVIEEQGDAATAFSPRTGTELALVRSDGVWQIDLMADDPTGEQRDAMLYAAEQLEDALKAAKAMIGEEGVTRNDIEAAFVGQMVRSVFDKIQENIEAPIPAETEKAIRAAVDQLAKAMEAPSVKAFKPVVAEECFIRGSQRFWEHCDESYAEYLESSGQSFRIEAIEQIACPMPGHASVQVTVAAKRPYGEESASEWLMLKKTDDGWQLTATGPGSILFPANLAKHALLLQDLPTASSVGSWTEAQRDAWRDWVRGKKFEQMAEVQRVTEVGGETEGEYEVETMYARAFPDEEPTLVVLVKARTRSPRAATLTEGWNATVVGIIENAEVKASRIEAEPDSRRRDGEDTRLDYSFVLRDAELP